VDREAIERVNLPKCRGHEEEEIMRMHTRLI